MKPFTAWTAIPLELLNVSTNLLTASVATLPKPLVNSLNKATSTPSKSLTKATIFFILFTALFKTSGAISDILS